MTITREQVVEAFREDPALFWGSIYRAAVAFDILVDEDLEVVDLTTGPTSTAKNARAHAQLFGKLLQRLRDHYDLTAWDRDIKEGND